MDAKEAILAGRTSLGIEFGSTRIKAVLLDDCHTVLAKGSFSWENQWKDGIWTYDLKDAVAGMQACYRNLCEELRSTVGVLPVRIGSIGISGMMHGLLALDAENRPVFPFRTWRNLMTEQAADLLTSLFSFNIPQRWSAAHLAQVLLNREDRANDICRMTTLAGYIHLLLTGEHVLGCTEASGMFPLDPGTLTYDARMEALFDRFLHEHGFPRRLREVFPRVLPAGAPAGLLHEAGARLLDPSGVLEAGIPLCPPEGDGATGLVCTGSLAPGSAAISAGTSVFGVFVTDHMPDTVRREIEFELTPSGSLLAQIHGNNGSSELDAWVSLFSEALARLGGTASPAAVYEMFFSAALDASQGYGHLGILAYNYLSGEHLTGLASGAPALIRRSDSAFSLASFARSEVYALFAPLACGARLLRESGIRTTSVLAHGGLFRTRGAAQKVLAAALQIPVSVREEAGEGGPYGMALLAAYAKNHADGETLADYLQNRVFAGTTVLTETPEDAMVSAYDAYLDDYLAGLSAERAAADFCREHPVS